MSDRCDRLDRDDVTALVDAELDAELAQHVAACPTCAARIDAYRGIATAIGAAQTADTRSPDYEARLASALDEVDRRRANPGRRWIGIGLSSLAAAAVVLVVLRLGDSRSPQLAVEIVRGDGHVRRGDDHLIGDRLRARASSRRPHVALRLYRDDVLVVACPPRCDPSTDGALAIDVTLDAPGSYQVLWLEAAAEIPPPRGDLAGDLARSSDAGAAYQIREITVR